MSIPVFGDIAIILNAPISAILAKRKKLGMQQVAPFVNLGLTLTHGLVPPTPGILAVSILLGADIGGIPELIDAGENGELFESGNADALAGKIRALWGDRARLDAYTKACGKTRFDTVEAYAEKLMRLYQG